MFPFAAVLWDMDGTLIDSERYWLEAEIELMASFGVTWTDRDQEFCIGGPMTRVQKYMAERANHVQPPEYFGTTLRKIMCKKLEKTIDFAPGALELLTPLQQNKIPMALVTASSRDIVDAAMHTIGFDTFPVTISADDVSLAKPHPEGYLKAAALLGVDIAQCLILEDSFVGTTAALASGAAVVGISHVGVLAESDRLHIVNSLTELSVADLSKIFLAQISG